MSTFIENLHCLVYISTAREPFTAEQLDALVQQAQAFNAQAGVTGALLYREGNFMQALEGPRSAIDRLMARIRADSRHHSVTVLYDQEARARRFAAWSMGLVRPETLSEAEIAHVSAPANAVPSPDRDVVLMLLDIFLRRMK